MARDFAKQFYNSRKWKRCRDSYFQSKHGLCERCQGVGKIVHHTVYLTPENIHDIDVSLNHQLLELLCQDCHNREHHEKYGVTMVGTSFDENGDLVQAPLSKSGKWR